MAFNLQRRFLHHNGCGFSFHSNGSPSECPKYGKEGTLSSKIKSLSFRLMCDCVIPINLKQTTVFAAGIGKPQNR